MNFMELRRRKSLTCQGRVQGGTTYLELNEDLNLHVKVDGTLNEAKTVATYCKRVFPSSGIFGGGEPCFYRQGVWVVYRWDPGILPNVSSLNEVAHSMAPEIHKIVALLH